MTAVSTAALVGAGSKPVMDRPREALMLVSKGEKAAAGGDVVEAEKAWRAALALHPDCIPAARHLRALFDRPEMELPIDQEGLQAAKSQLGEGFAQTQTDHFVILSDCGRDWSAAKAQLLERTYHQFFRFMGQLGLEAAPPKHKLLCILINDHAAYAAFARTQDAIEAPWVAGYYATMTNRVVFYNDATGPGFERAIVQLGEYEDKAREARSAAVSARRSKQREAAAKLDEQARVIAAHVEQERGRLSKEAKANSDAKTIHEATHLIAFNCGLQSRTHQFPFWITEGLAVCFETENPGAAFGPDRPVGVRDAELRGYKRDNKLIPLSTLVQLNGVPTDEPETAPILYAQAGGLVRYLYRHERTALSGYFRDVLALPGGFVNPKKHLEMFEQRFGNPDALERRWMAAFDK